MPADSPVSLHDFPDRAIREALQQPGNLRDLLEVVVPDLAPAFDCRRAELLDRQFLLDDWRRRESDLLFRIPFQAAEGEQPALVCVLIEHQSAPDPLMPLRMLLYAVLFWEREWKDWEGSQAPRGVLRLSPVVPIVLHTGPRPWTNPNALVDLIGGPELLHEFVPRWRTLFWDLAERTPQALLEMAGEFLQALAVVRAERADAASFLAVFTEVVQRLESLSDRDTMRWHDLVRFVLSWGWQRRPEPELAALLAAAQASQADPRHREEVRAMGNALGQTLGERLWAEGRAEGRAEGELRSARDILRDLLVQRFGDLPEPIARRMETCADLQRLRAAIQQVYLIDSLDQLPWE
jgi:hypothetical protein